MSKAYKKRLRIMKAIFRVIFLTVITSLIIYLLWKTGGDVKQYILAFLFIIPLNSIFNYLAPMFFVKSKYELGLAKYLPEISFVLAIVGSITYLTIYEYQMAQAAFVLYLTFTVLIMGVDKALEVIDRLFE